MLSAWLALLAPMAVGPPGPLCTAVVLFSFDLDKVLLAITKTE